MKVMAILLDTRSIQRYIFSGNQLKTNIGASYLVDRLFEVELVENVLVEKNYIKAADKNLWKSQDTIRMTEDEKLACEVAYIGGGNALILINPSLFDDVEAKATEIVQIFTRNLLTTHSGLRIGVAIGELNLAEGKFQDSLDDLYKQLKTNQNLYFPQVTIPYTGLTLSCDYSGEVADNKYTLPNDDKKEQRYVSSEFLAKWKAADEANKVLKETFAEILEDKYTFPTEIEKLGQIETQDYIGVVHIDGNNMGVRFGACKELKERKKLSNQVAKKVKQSFAKLLKGIVAEYSVYQQSKDKNTQKNLFNLKNDILPIRPLILGGDDVTFVCAGRMAVEYAKRFIEYMREQNEGADEIAVECCAGVTIVPTSYPFFRAYQLAEQLCGEAKQKSRKVDSSWLDFAILHGEQAPTLSQIREQEYTGAIGKAGAMHFGPYKIGDKEDKYSIDKLLDAVEQMRKMPNNKVKEMRYVLSKGAHDIRHFITLLKQNTDDKGNCTYDKLPQIEGWEKYHEHLWYSMRDGKDYCENSQTPYIDVIELMDFVLPKKGAGTDENTSEN